MATGSPAGVSRIRQGISNPRDALLRQEVKELTDLLRTDPVLEALRHSIRSKGFHVEQMMLAGFVEDEEEHESGALVTGDGRVFLYERETKLDSVGFVSFDEPTDVSTAIRLYPAVRVALESVRQNP